MSDTSKVASAVDDVDHDKVSTLVSSIKSVVMAGALSGFTIREVLAALGVALVDNGPADGGPRSRGP
jgi:hypothetical protein